MMAFALADPAGRQLDDDAVAALLLDHRLLGAELV
jgi:hypothetical protein